MFNWFVSKWENAWRDHRFPYNQQEVRGMRQRAVRRLHEDPNFSDLNAEEAERAEETRRKELYMEVIELRYRDQPQLICSLFDSLKPTADDIKREPEQVLRLTVSADGCVLSLIPIPGREVHAWVETLQQQRALDEIPIDG